MKNAAKFLLLLFLFATSTTWAQGIFKPGAVVPEPYLKVFGSERFFSVSLLSEDLRGRMQGNSYKADGGVSWDDLRYLRVLHRDADGNAIVGEMVCNAAITADLLEIFKALFEAGYPIEKMRLVDYYGGDDAASMRDNNTSCFNQRAITAGGRVSRHSFGMAVDINPLYNPYFKVKASGKVVVEPVQGNDYLDRSVKVPYMISKEDLCYRLFKQHGFHWGGEWASGKDYQHFEK